MMHVPDMRLLSDTFSLTMALESHDVSSFLRVQCKSAREEDENKYVAKEVVMA